ncbi:DUF1275 domain-containing protein [Aerococcaceae bacterium NML160702]|nr:DUF1275 domain-containing protein [Aerococcaceae bacterium NML160702]
MKQEQSTAWLNGWLFLLNGVAGFMNLATILYLKTASTHYTGHLSQLAFDLGRGNFSHFSWLLAVIASFVCGSMLSGYLFADRVFYLKRRYGVTLMILGAGHLLLALLLYHPFWLICYCAFCAGTQNGLFIFYRGALVRTTHFTGYLTDIGFELGRTLKGQHDAFWKVRFYLASIGYFVLGGVLAYSVGESALKLVGVGYLLAGSYYFVFRNYFYHT